MIIVKIFIKRIVEKIIKGIAGEIKCNLMIKEICI